MMDDLRHVVLPRPPERVAQLMQRIFRAQVEEEQKMLIDSDSIKLTGSGSKRTPAKAAQAQTPPRPGQPAAQEEKPPEGSTQMLPGTPARKPVTPVRPAPAGAARPAPRTPPPAARKEGAGDTLLDMGGAAGLPAGQGTADDEVPGGTLMLKPGPAPPPQPPKSDIPTDPMPDAYHAP